MQHPLRSSARGLRGSSQPGCSDPRRVRAAAVESVAAGLGDGRPRVFGDLTAGRAQPTWRRESRGRGCRLWRACRDGGRFRVPGGGCGVSAAANESYRRPGGFGGSWRCSAWLSSHSTHSPRRVGHNPSGGRSRPQCGSHGASDWGVTQVSGAKCQAGCLPRMMTLANGAAAQRFATCDGLRRTTIGGRVAVKHRP